MSGSLGRSLQRLAWVLATTAAVALIAPLAPFMIFVGFILAPFVGVIFGVLQGLTLPVARARFWGWVLGTVLGWFIGWAYGYLLWISVAANVRWVPGGIVFIGAALLGGWVIGAAQSAPLRAGSYIPHRWIVIHAIAYATALGLILAPSSTLIHIPIPSTSQFGPGAWLHFMVAAGQVGLIYVAISSLGLGDLERSAKPDD